MKKQVILGLIVMTLLFGMVGTAQAVPAVLINSPSANEEISGNYTINVSTNVLCSWVGLNYSRDNSTWVAIDANTSESKWFNISWNTTAFCTGNYSLNVTSNRTESYWVNVTIYNDVITLVTPATGATINGAVYSLSATTNTNRSYVNFSYSSDNVTWTLIGTDDTDGKAFTLSWDTTAINDGTYYVSATTNCTNETEPANINETAFASGVKISNPISSPEFSPIVVACLIGLLSATAILLRKKKE